MSGDEDDDDDVPWASPEIRQNYEAALGRFILEFNQVDNLLGDVIETVLSRLKRDELATQCARWPFWQKLLVLDLLKSSTEGAGLQDVSVAALEEIASDRNKVAHGHFDQNPFSGEFDVVVRNVRKQYSAEQLDALAAKTNAAWMELRHAEAFYTFSDAPN